MSTKREAVVARQNVAATVAAAFLPAEKSAEAAITHGGNCMTVIIEQRSAALLPADAGAEALKLIAIGTQLAAEAHLQFAAAHRSLRDAAAEFGLPMALGPYCAPNELFTTGSLRLVD